MIKATDILETIRDLDSLREDITSKDVDALEREFKKVVKALDRIDDGKSLFDTALMFDRWLREMIHLVNDRLLGIAASSVPKDVVFTKENPTYRAATSLFDSLSSLYVPPFIPGAIASKFLSNKILQSVAAPLKYSSDWDYAYYAWRVGRGSHRRDMINFGEACFSTIRSVLERIGGSSYDYYSSTTSKVGGVTVIIQRGEADENRPDLEKRIQDIKDVISETSRLFKSLGLSFLLKNLTITVDLQTGFGGGAQPAAEYDIIHDTVKVFNGTKDALHSLIHELGHRIWYTKFDEETQEFWNDYVQASVSYLSSSDVDAAYEIFLQAWETTPANQSIYPAFLRILKKKRKDLAVKFSLLFFVAEEVQLEDIIKDPYYNRSDIDWAWDYLASVLTTFRYLPSKDFSSYANTSPEEAWAESFSSYVRGKSLTKETKSQIEALLRYEGPQPVEGFWERVVSTVRGFLGSGAKTLAGAPA
jgi:hypothetical protein